MVVGESVINFSEVISSLPPHIWQSINDLIIIFKAVGVAMIAYVIYVIAMGAISIRRSRRIKTIEEKVFAIDKKLNKLVRISKLGK